MDHEDLSAWLEQFVALHEKRTEPRLVREVATAKALLDQLDVIRAKAAVAQINGAKA